MAKPRWLRRAIPIFGIILFLTDTGSDSYVGISLILRCHIKYGVSVLSFFYLPGLLSGGIFFHIFLDDQSIFVKYCDHCCAHLAAFLLGTFLGPFIFVPGALYLLVKAAIDIDDDDNQGTAKA